MREIQAASEISKQYESENLQRRGRRRRFRRQALY